MYTRLQIVVYLSDLLMGKEQFLVYACHNRNYSKHWYAGVFRGHVV